jgi:hypothetical protein
MIPGRLYPLHPEEYSSNSQDASFTTFSRLDAFGGIDINVFQEKGKHPVMFIPSIWMVSG